MYMKYIIKITNFKKKYRLEEVKIKDFIIKHKISLLVGKNGSGKSTILRSISGLINYEGDIDIAGKVSYMSEFPYFPIDLTVYQFINSLKRISRRCLPENEITKMLETFNLFDKQDLLLSSLSKGMKAKVNLIQCLMEEVDIYLLDEPMSGLDKEGVQSLINYIKDSSKNYIISTHLVDDFKELSYEVIDL